MTDQSIRSASRASVEEAVDVDLAGLVDIYASGGQDELERRIADLGLDVELRDIDADADARRDLREATGRETVPCLRIDGSTGAPTWVHESSSIIDLLEERA